MSEVITKGHTEFAEAVRQGLSAPQKKLSSKYFYDARGDVLFQRIMAMDAYYLTDCEYAIFQANCQAWLSQFAGNGRPFQLIEFGAGDGYKTKVLLSHFLAQRAQFRYVPIDISAHAVDALEADLRRTYSDLTVAGIRDDYFRALAQLRETNPQERKVVLFLGSNIGNFTDQEAVGFLQELQSYLQAGDLLLIGFDLKKDPDVIRRAYNDPEGVTRDFNLNLLRRINETFDADFDLAAFAHVPNYDPMTGEARSFLVSRRAQTVRIAQLDLCVEFDAWEAIYTEKSQKYDLRTIERIARQAGFAQPTHYFDERRYYVNSLWRVD